ncbi:MAG: sensor histidine kinase [Pseudomonadota bacterium]
MTDVDNTQAPSRSKWKAFNLIYLTYYFLGWFLQTPGVVDIVAIVVGLALFLPLYSAAYEKTGTRYLPHIAAMELLSWVLTPFAGIQGVFHVYACVQSGFQRPAKRAIALIAGLSVAHLAFCLVTAQTIYTMTFTIVIGLLTGIACIGGASGIEREQTLLRSQVRERQQARIAERERIAHDLHDLLGHTLTMVALKSEVADKMIERDPQRAREEIRDVAKAARSALTDIRAAVYDMTITTVDAELALAKQALDAAGVALEIRNAVPPLSPPAGKALGLTIREAATNIVRHADASRAVIAFDQVDDRLQLTVSDNGEGAKDTNTQGSGLAGVKKRIAALGGETTISSDGGMHISITLPLDVAASIGANQ